MIFNRNDLLFHILGVYKIPRKKVTMRTKGRDYHTISYRLSGDSCFLDDTKKYKIHTGDLLYIPAGLTYTQQTQREEIIAVHLDILNYARRDIAVLPAPDRQQADRIFTQIYEIWAGRESGYYYRCLALLYELMADICRYGAGQNLSADEKMKIQPSIDYMNRHYADAGLNMQRVAAASGFSEVYFRRLFKKYYAVQPIKYLRQLRIAKSIPLLKSDYYSIGEIAAMVGFDDPKYFSSVFRQQIGSSPSGYKANPRQPEIR